MENMLENKGSGLETIDKDRKEVIRVEFDEATKKLGEEWKHGLDLIKKSRKGSCFDDIKELKTYLECVNLSVKTAREIVGLQKSGVEGAGSDGSILEKLGLREI